MMTLNILVISLTLIAVGLILGVTLVFYTDYQDYKRRKMSDDVHDVGHANMNQSTLPDPKGAFNPQDFLSKILKWFADQQENAKLAWTIIVGIAMFFGYNLTLSEPPTTPEPVDPPPVVAPIYEPVDGDTTIVVEGVIKSINGYRVRPVVTE